MTKHKLVRLSLSTLFLGVLMVVVPTVSADTGCDGQYGNGQYGSTNCPSNEISLDKKVRNPITGEFKDNLLAGDAAYSPDSEVTYSLAVTNNSNHDFSEVKVTDTLPKELKDPKLVDETGIFDKTVSTNSDGRAVLSFKFKDFKAGETRTFKVTAQVKDASVFDKNVSLNCDVTNEAKAEADGKSGEDKAKLCVQTSVLGKTTLPNAGPEDYLPLMPFAILGTIGIGLFIRKPATLG